MAKAKKKKRSSGGGGIATYIRKINNTPAVKKIAKKIREEESKLDALKRKKKAAVKQAQKAYKKKHR